MNDPVRSPKQSFTAGDKKLSSDSSVANAFSQHFFFDAPITRDELACALRSLSSGKSPGGDGIHSEFLSHLGPNAFETVWTFFNLIWNSGIVPAEWRTSIIIPIHKKGKDPNMFQNYRPISLTSIAGKAMEKIVVRRLNYYLETNRFIAKKQAGFRSSRSTNQHVALLNQCVKDALDNNHVLTAVFIDLKSAYDNV
ncbi:uncharacterized protein CEXT_276911 [Caerostris extrusa]|uniref:Reverse transcriptase domain-containing protein n=1 Tax=Caerostris extrusa TaxID=172846 RepID=A0AAV4WJH1_CAEEX|nr:uncharacterized protein CEXT_276911 [Caerostris extrusa]